MVFVWPTSHIGMLHPSGDKKARGRTTDFLSFADASKSNVSYAEAKKLLSCTPNQAETRKSLFEELGLLFVPYRSDKIILTPLGQQFADLLSEADLENLDASTAKRATALLIWAQCRTQINRPQSRGVPQPEEADWTTCNVKPYATAWMAARDLDDTLYMQEFFGALRFLHRTDSYQATISKISEARTQGKILASRSRWANRGPEMNYAIYWKSHLTVAQQLMDWDPEVEAFHVRPAMRDVIDAAIRFQSGCGGNRLAGITASTWSNSEEYFMSLAGAACPPFLATGSPKLATFDGTVLADLSTYDLVTTGHTFNLTGGPELCSLPLKMPCYHAGHSKRLMRIDDKRESSNGMVSITLGLGRPITNVALLEASLGKIDD